MMKLSIIKTLTPGVLFLFIGLSNPLFSQSGGFCEDAKPFCSDESYDFENEINTTAPNGPNYGACPTVILGNGLANGVWYYMQIEDAGTLNLHIHQTSGPNETGTELDLDFVMWGPYTSLPDACTQIMNGDPPIQRSFSPDGQEDIGIGALGGSNYHCGNDGYGPTTPPPAQVGEIYVVMITNPSGLAGYVSFEQTGGTGSVDCGIVSPCNIDNFTGNTSACDNNSQYSVTGSIEFTEAPVSGDLIVEDCNGNQIIVASAPFTSPVSYNLTGLDADGNPCSVNAYFSVDPGCSETINFTAPDCICPSPNLIINNLQGCSPNTVDLANAIDASSDPATLKYYASQSDAQNDINELPSSTVSSSGSYWVRGENPSDPTCYEVHEIQVTISSVTYNINSTDPTCGNNDGEIIINPTSFGSIASYSIDNGTTTQTGGTFSNLGAGTYNIKIIDNNGCEATGTYSLNSQNSPTIDNINTIDPSCSNDDGELEVATSGGTSPLNYEWFDGNNQSIGTGTTIDGLSGGNYSIKVTDGNGCVATDNITLTDPPVTDDASFMLTDFCSGSSNSADNIASPGGTFSIVAPLNDTAVIDAATGEISNGIEGTTYTIEYETSGACSSTSTEQVTVLFSPNVSFSANPNTGAPPLPVDFENTTTSSDNFIWDFGEGDTIHDNNVIFSHIYGNIGDYIVILTGVTTDGCVDTAMTHIIVKFPSMEYTFPNIFTPNDDDQNDMFKLIDANWIKEIEIVILNRWGNVVFEDNKVNFNWNGKVKNDGIDCNDGTYFYKATLRGLDGTEKMEHGFLQLNRDK